MKNAAISMLNKGITTFIDFREGGETRQDIPIDQADADFNDGATLSVRTGGNRDVFVTLLDGRRVRFKFVIRNAGHEDPEFTPGSPQLIGAFESDPGVHAQLIFKGNRFIILLSVYRATQRAKQKQ